MKKKGEIIKMIFTAIFIFLVAFGAGMASKVLIKPSWSKQYNVTWSEELGTLKTDLPYGDGEANTFDLYLPKESGKKTYGLVVYLHAGGFTSGDKKDDQSMLSWLTKKGYVAAGINYTLRSETNNSSVIQQSNEIKEAIPKVIEAAKEAGYPIDKMTIAGGSAGHALAMIYAYRDGKEAPVPLVFTFGGVGPSGLYKEDWTNYGFDKDTDEARTAAAGLFSIMAGTDISVQEIIDGSYLEKVKPVSAVDWVAHNPVPTVVAYGTHDTVQPFKASLRLKQALEDNHVDYQYFEMPHSGHGLQNDSAISKQWMEAIEKYLDKYMPVEK